MQGIMCKYNSLEIKHGERFVQYSLVERQSESLVNVLVMKES